MVAVEYSGGLKPLSIRIAVVAGVAVAASVASTPSAWLDPAVDASGLPQMIAAASSPIGATGRTLLALGAGAMVAGLVWAAVTLFARFTNGRARARTIAPDAPVLRRADAHPDAPPRRPLSASEDLGPPIPIATRPPVQRREQPLPDDLDLPLAAFDPAAVPAVPAEPVRPVAPLATRRALIDPGERFETFDLPTVVRPSRPAAAAAEVGSIGALLDRLERSTQRTQRRRADIDQTLGRLRALAAG